MAVADCNWKEQGFTFGLRFQFSLVEGAASSMETWEPVWGSESECGNERMCLGSLHFSLSCSHFSGPLVSSSSGIQAGHPPFVAVQYLSVDARSALTDTLC